MAQTHHNPHRAHVVWVVTPYLAAPTLAREWLNVSPLRVFRCAKPLASAAEGQERRI
ncbi:MAG TPA: hypothetical protein VHK01_17590 [Lacipirellulaceae bacterium]|nr:hypothetical protein [Lacipirellulaceae bacterium]